MTAEFIVTVLERQNGDTSFQCSCGTSLYTRGMTIHLAAHVRKVINRTAATWYRRDQLLGIDVDTDTYADAVFNELTEVSVCRDIFPGFNLGDSYFSYLIAIGSGRAMASAYLADRDRRQAKGGARKKTPGIVRREHAIWKEFHWIAKCNPYNPEAIDYDPTLLIPTDFKAPPLPADILTLPFEYRWTNADILKVVTGHQKVGARVVLPAVHGGSQVVRYGDLPTEEP